MMHFWSKGGLELTVLHSIAAVATQVLIRSGEGLILVDAGDGTLRDLLSASIAPEVLGGILLTHGHYDHVGGLHSLLGYMKMRERRELLPVLLPRGSREGATLVTNFLEVSSGAVPFHVDLVELSDGDVLALGPFHISAVGVTHCSAAAEGEGLRMPALGYRVSRGEVTVAITGDCGDTASVRELVRGTDLAVVEASFDSYTSEYDKRVHLTEKVAREVGALAEEHILIHRPIT